jgi:transposase
LAFRRRSAGSNAGRGREASRRSLAPASRSPLETHKRWLLDLVAAEPDLTLDEIRARLACEKKLKTGKSSVGRFYERHDITFKKNSARRRAESA